MFHYNILTIVSYFANSSYIISLKCLNCVSIYKLYIYIAYVCLFVCVCVCVCVLV